MKKSKTTSMVYNSSWLLLVLLLLSCQSTPTNKRAIQPNTINSIGIQFSEAFKDIPDAKSSHLYYQFSPTISVDSLKAIYWVNPIDTFELSPYHYFKHPSVGNQSYSIVYPYNHLPYHHENLYSFYQSLTAFVKTTSLLLVFPYSRQLVTYDASQTKLNYWLNEQAIDLEQDVALLQQVDSASFRAVWDELPAPPK